MEFLTERTVFWIVLYVLIRLTYIVSLSLLLGHQARHHSLNYHKFKKWASLIIQLDGLFFILIVPQLRWEFSTSYNSWIIIAGAALVLIGLGVKGLAIKALGGWGYFDDFFLQPGEKRVLQPKGIYKYLKNPMYGWGYAQAYGWSLMWLSISGLFLSIFAQATLFLFYYFIERPNFLSVYGVRLEQK